MSIYPFSPDKPYGSAGFGGDPSGPTIHDIFLIPPSHLPDRLTDMAILGREPTPWDVETISEFGGFKATMPVYVSAMGSTKVAHKHSQIIAQNAAQAGIPLVMGENIYTAYGYRKRRHSDLPSFKERLFYYLNEIDLEAPIGGVVIQQSVEDAADELWHQVYTDPEIVPYIESGLIGFEIKIGQGAKAGLGGLTLVDREGVEREHYNRDYFIPEKTTLQDGKIERFSAPGTFTFDILESQLRKLTNDFPHCKFWVKLPPSRDCIQMGEAATRGGAHMIILDGGNSGTAMAPTSFLNHVGYPTTVIAAKMRRRRPHEETAISGGFNTAVDVFKGIALGASAVGLGRCVLDSALQGEDKMMDFWHDIHTEFRMLTYAMGHLKSTEITDVCLATCNAELAKTLVIEYALDPDLN